MSNKGISICAVLLLVLAVPAVASTPSGKPFEELWEELNNKLDYTINQSDVMLNITKKLSGNIDMQFNGMWTAISINDKRIDVLENESTPMQSLKAIEDLDEKVDRQSDRMRDATTDLSVRVGKANKKSDEALQAVRELSDRVGNASNRTTTEQANGTLNLVMYTCHNTDKCKCLTGTLIGGGVECPSIGGGFTRVNYPSIVNWIGACGNNTVGSFYPPVMYAICAE